MFSGEVTYIEFTTFKGLLCILGERQGWEQYNLRGSCCQKPGGAGGLDRGTISSDEEERMNVRYILERSGRIKDKKNTEV